MTYSALSRPSVYSRPVVRLSAPALVIPDVSRVVLYVVLTCLLGLLYLVEVTKTDALGYQVNTYTEQATALKQEHDDLTLVAAQAQNLDRVQNYSNEIGMVSASPQ